MENIIAARFEMESEGYQAITTLKQTPLTEKCAIMEMFLAKRTGNNFQTLDSFDSGVNTADDTLVGGLVGTLIGVLGGPVGMLLGGSYGLMAGSLFDLDDAVNSVSMIENVAGKMKDGDVSLIILAEEADTQELDAKLSAYKCEVTRFDAAVVAAEVDEALELQEEMEAKARAQMIETKKEEFKAKIEEKRAKIAADFDKFKKNFE